LQTQRSFRLASAATEFGEIVPTRSEVGTATQCVYSLLTGRSREEDHLPTDSDEALIMPPYFKPLETLEFDFGD
jgi:hypothetical protein